MKKVKEPVDEMTFYDDDLDDILREKLDLIKPTPPRHPDIVLQSRDDYLRKVKYLQFGKPVFVLAGLFHNKPWQSLFSQRPSLLPFAAALLLIFGLLFGSFGTVYAAQDSLPNDLLYSLKLSAENLRLAFTLDTEAKISLLTTYSGRRVQEAISLTLQGQPIPADLPSMVDAQLDELLALSTSLDEAASEEALKGIQIHLRDQDKDMTNAMNGLPDGLEPQLSHLRQLMTERHQLAQLGVDVPHTFQRQLRNQLAKPTTIPITSTITTTLTITPARYGPSIGPGPCEFEFPGECPAGHIYGPGPFGPLRHSPVPHDLDGDAPEDAQGPGPLQPSETPKVGEPKQTPDPNGGDQGNKDNGDSASKKGKP